ncbi:MAG: hypothetical protein QME66_09330 [Candidatus Eisenbacteria bacterium]|nr:hypothetical protein [Candidatus Eisenbacteria bacterium]
MNIAETGAEGVSTAPKKNLFQSVRMFPRQDNGNQQPPATEFAEHAARVNSPPSKAADKGFSAEIDGIASRIKQFGRDVPRFTTGLPEADELVYGDRFAFLVACSLDRDAKSQVIWRIPYYIKQSLGHLDPEKLSRMSLEEIGNLLNRLPAKPRYMNDAPFTIRQLAQTVSNEFGNNADAVWIGRTVLDIRDTLLAIRSVGPGIANMTINLLHRYFGIAFQVDDFRRIDVKPDVHVERVFLRTGLSTGAERALFAARLHSPEYPGELDLGAWEIGKRWCHANAPLCGACPLGDTCPKMKVHITRV